VLDDVVESYADLFTQKRISLTTRIEGLQRPIYAEPQSLHRCLLNLVTNAADAVPEIDGQISIIVDELADDSVVISVEDNGPGVSEAHLPKIFDPFFSTKGAKGTGLGLAITRKIIEEHGGELAVGKSDLGGAAFRITFPMDYSGQEAPSLP
jgi:signal transduction histidine kinase